MEKEIKQQQTKNAMTKEAIKSRKKEKKEVQRKLDLCRFLERYKGNPEELVYRLQKRLKTNYKIAMKEYAALGYVITKEQQAFLLKKERNRREKFRLKREAKRQRALREEGRIYRQEIVESFYETQEIPTVEDWLVLKDEIF